MGLLAMVSEVSAIADIVERYAEAVRENFIQPVSAQPEDQLKTPVGNLLQAIGETTGRDVAYRTEVRVDDINGRPDIGVIVDQLLTGHVELKRPGLGARPENFKKANRDQWERFKALPNLIYTDGSEWSLYRSGELEKRIEIADDVSANGKTGIDQKNSELLGKLLRDFLYWEPIVPSTVKGLAEFLAPLARILRDEVRKALKRETSTLRELAEQWSEILFPEGGEAQFADAYAQTLTYALLLARFEGAESLRPLAAADALQQEHILLAEALQLLEARPVRQELIMPIELLERAIRSVERIQPKGGRDPWLYFYEHFLGAYDPELRKSRGVYYTPVPVVQTQVRLAGELLRTRFGKTLSFADDDIVVLDPAVGTGTYPLAVIDHAAEAVQRQLGPGAVKEKLMDLADRLYGFEILVGSYSVAHLRLTQRLENVGVADKPVRIYLTDTLESPHRLTEWRASLLQTRMTEERSRALAVKKDVRVFVCLGNPPYDREEQTPNNDTGKRKGGWVRYGDDEQTEPPILEDFSKPVQEAGSGIHLKNMYNDYVYFWRWALWKVLDSTEKAGIVTFITASSYIKGPGFAGMRRKMREVFDDLWIIDLEGDSRGTRRTENVFDIQTPVAIAIGIRDRAPNPGQPARVKKAKLTGSAASKLALLADDGVSFATFDWQECMNEWAAPFHHKNKKNYNSWPKVTEIFPWQHSGVQLKRTWPIGETRNLLVNRWEQLKSSDNVDLYFKETDDRKVNKSYRHLINSELLTPPITAIDEDLSPELARYGHRSLDRQWIIADSRVGDRMRPELWRSHGPQQVYIVGLLTEVVGVGPAVMATADIPDLHYFSGRGGKNVIPLWRDIPCKLPNITIGLLTRLSETYGIDISAEQLFAYAYGVLAQPAYVERFWDALELPPPRLPLTKNKELFLQIADHGSELLHLHTYGRRFSRSDIGYIESGSARCMKGISPDGFEGFSYDPETGVLRVGDGEFSPVAPAVWEYSVSGLQVVKSWLGYRKRKRSGRKSSPLDDIRPERWESKMTEELLELLWVLEGTLDLQPEGERLLELACASDLFSQDELPVPTAQERQPPRTAAANQNQQELPSSDQA